MERIDCDVLVIGSGGAGLRAAVAARKAGAEVCVVSKAKAGKGTCTTFSGGVFNGDPTGELTERHFRRTLQAGRGLNQKELVAVLVDQGPQRLQELVAWGMRSVFHKGELHTLGRAPVWGAGIVNCLIGKCRETGVRFIDRATVTALRLAANGIGVTAYQPGAGAWRFIAAGAVVLAAGGAGGLYQRSDNPRSIVGDGYVLALDAGAVLQDMEFVQFYPLGLAEPGMPPFLIPPSLADAGRLVSDRGEDILKKYGISERPAGERARDRLSQAFFNEIQLKGGAVWLELMGISEAEWNVDPFAASTRQILGERYGARHRPVRVAPMAHHVMGGVRIDADGATDVPGLYAAGEVTGGLHGANRLGGNALTEIVVFGARAGAAAAQWARHARPASVATVSSPEQTVRTASPFGRSGEDVDRWMSRLRCALWTDGGITRSAEGLRRALNQAVETGKAAAGIMSAADSQIFLKAHALWVASRTGELILEAALQRKESRGAHSRADFPETDDMWAGHLQVSAAPSGERAWRFERCADGDQQER